MRASAAENALSACPNAGSTTSMSRIGFGNRGAVDLVGGAGRAQNIVGGDAALLARELIAAMRAADALENAVAHQRLQHRLEMPRRQAVAICQGLRRQPDGRGH